MGVTRPVPSDRSRRILPWWAAFVPLLVVIASLVVLALVSSRTQQAIGEARSIALGQVEPAQRAVGELRSVLAEQGVARRALRLTADEALAAELQELFLQEARLHERLRLGREGLSGEVEAAFDRLDRRAAARTAVVGAIGSREGGGLHGALAPAADPAFAGLAEAAAALESALHWERQRLREAVWSRERRQIETNWLLVTLALLAVGALAELGRQTRVLALASRAGEAGVRRLAEEKERFIRGVTHDLKNPLSAVDAYAQLLDAEIRGPLNAGQREFVRRLRRAAQETLGTVNDLLELSRAAATTPSLHLGKVDLRQLVQELAESNRIPAELAGVDLEVDPGEPRPPVTTDAARVRQVLGNLLSNALKYSPRGGTVRMRVRSEPEPAGEPRVALDVDDEGPGIAPADRERVFEEFYRADGERPGSGLGLAASRRIAELLGGEVRLEERTRGSRFTLLLPAAEGTRAAAGAAKPVRV